MSTENETVDAFLQAREALRTLLDTVSCGDGADARVIDLRGEVWGLDDDGWGKPCLVIVGSFAASGSQGRVDSYVVGELTFCYASFMDRSEMYVLTTAMRDDEGCVK